MLLTQGGEKEKDLKEKILRAFDEAVFLSELVERTGEDMVELWKAVLELEKEGKVAYYSWRGKTAIVKRR
jgi:predicted Rossmann fold nucleotide-binding protein DprA/Smf involved in DNA uptake